MVNLRWEYRYPVGHWPRQIELILLLLGVLVVALFVLILRVTLR